MSKKDKREAVVQAALELIAENGFHGAPMVLIAERARVAIGTIYLYFESKDDLIIETYNCLEGQMLASVMKHYPELWSIRERFLHIGHQLVNYFMDSPTKFRFVEQFHNSPYGIARHRDRILNRQGNSISIELFEEGRQQQIIKDLPLSVLDALTFGPLIEICRNHIFQFYELDEPLVARTVEACWDAVRR
jgi:AcrR family transcriptional regulator